MKKVSVFAVVLALVAFSGTAVAGTVDHPFYILASGVVAWEQGIEDRDLTKYDVGTIDFGAAWGFSAAAGYYLLDWLGLQFNYSHLPSLDWESDVTINGGKYEADLSIMLNTYCLEGKFIAPPNSFPIRPYGILGAGYMTTDVTATIKSPGFVARESASQNDFFGRIGLGGQIDFGERFSAHLEADYNMGTGKSDYIKYVTVMAGLGVGF